MVRPLAENYDLRTSVPNGWIQTGLSAPKTDSVNMYRTPTAPESTLTFETLVSMYVQYRYQLYSPDQQMTGTVTLNGKTLDRFIFKAGQFQNREVSGFTQTGRNVLQVDVKCGDAACILPAIHQYWTQVELVVPRSPIDMVGLGVERWWLDAPGSALVSSGTGQLQYDGVNFLRYLTGQQFKVSWPEGTRPIDASLQVAADQPFRATFLVGDAVLVQLQGNAVTTVAPTLSLVKYSQARNLTVKVQCLKTPHTPCGRIYFTRVSAIPPFIAAPPTTLQLALGVMLLFAALLFLWCWLRLSVRRAA